MNHIIKFTHTYAKLLGKDDKPITYAKLLDVIPRRMEDVSSELIAWDTDQGTYKLPQKGQYLMLIFMKPGKKDTFCTFRRHTQAKEEYYRKSLGEIFYIQINESAVSVNNG